MAGQGNLAGAGLLRFVGGPARVTLLTTPRRLSAWRCSRLAFTTRPLCFPDIITPTPTHTLPEPITRLKHITHKGPRIVLGTVYRSQPISNMSSARGRGGKFNKVKRGGGKKFSRDLQPLNADGEVVGMWGEQPDKVDEESSGEEESSEEESSEDEEGKPAQEELTREQRRELAKKRKQAAIAKKSQKAPEAGDMPTDSEEEDDDMPANPNHTAKARTQATKAPVDADDDSAAKGKGKQKDLSQLSRREREALQAQANKDRYDKLHAEGKTEQARADLERLKLVRERREAEAARKKAEAEERAELEKEKKELMEREARRREQAMGKANRLAKGGKKKA